MLRPEQCKESMIYVRAAQERGATQGGEIDQQIRTLFAVIYWYQYHPYMFRWSSHHRQGAPKVTGFVPFDDGGLTTEACRSDTDTNM
jgi:hypothetical protein